MATVEEARRLFPEFAQLDDDSLVNVLQRTVYPDMSREQVASGLGVKPSPPPPPPPSSFLRRAADYGLSAVQGAIQVPQAAVGLADLATGGRVGKALENEGGTFGFRPDEANAYLESLKSPEQQAATKRVADASQGDEGDDQALTSKIGRVAVAALKNPSVVAQTVVQSLPSMMAGGVLGRGALWLGLSAADKAAILALPVAEQAGAIVAASRVGAGVAGGIGEGVTTMGQQAEQIRTDDANPDRLLTGKQVALAAGSGAVTGLIGMGSGTLAQKLGIENAENLLVGAHADPAAAHGLVRRVIGGAVTEGLLEEFPQSVQEQVAQNVATNQPWDKDVDQQAVLGALSGGAMGMGAQVFHGEHTPGKVLREDIQPATGPLSTAANIGTTINATVADAHPTPTAPAPTPPELADALLKHANERAAELETKAAGTKEETDAKTGKVTPAVEPVFLTPAEQAEHDFLKDHGGNADALARAYHRSPEDTIAAIERQGRQDVADQRDFTPTRIAPAPAPVAKAPVEDDANPSPLEGDIMAKYGGPFKSRVAAVRAQNTQPDPAAVAIASVDGGWVLRPLAAAAKMVDDAANQAATSPTNDLPEPTEAQKREGNYQLGHLNWNGLDLSFENPKGSERKGIDPNGKPWSVEMPAHYGYVRGHKLGADGDHVDIYMGEHPESGHVFVVDQQDANTGKWDEHKAILGASSLDEATNLYDAGFSDGKGEQRRSAITPMSVDEFKTWLRDGDTTKPIGKVAGAQVPEGASPGSEDRTRTTPEAPAPAAAPAEPPHPNARTRKVAARVSADEQRADYFTPGNIVKGYGGFDEVLAYSPPDANHSWSVKVQRVNKVGDEWVREGKPQDARTHATEPEVRNVADGPVARLGHVLAAEVKYSEPRADRKPFPNAPDRGVAEKAKEAAAPVPKPESESVAPAPVAAAPAAPAFPNARTRAVAEKAAGAAAEQPKETAVDRRKRLVAEKASATAAQAEVAPVTPSADTVDHGATTGRDERVLGAVSGRELQGRREALRPGQRSAGDRQMAVESPAGAKIRDDASAGGGRTDRGLADLRNRGAEEANAADDGNSPGAVANTEPAGRAAAGEMPVRSAGGEVPAGRSAELGLKPGGMGAQALRAHVEPIVKSWKNGPKGGVTVVQSATDLPEDILDGVKMSGAVDDGASAYFVPSTESVYLIADNIKDTADAERALFHETYGHYGMRAILGDAYAPEMMRLRMVNQNVAAEASMWFAKYGRQEVASRVGRGMDRLAAEREVRLLSTEEALADRAGKNEPIKGWQIFASKVQKAIRAIGLDSVANWLEHRTEAETMAFLNAARAAVQDGAASRAGAPGAPVASRPIAKAVADRLSKVADRLNSGPKIVGQTSRVYTPEQLAAMKNVGFQVQPSTIQERVAGLWKDAGKKMAQGIVDQFAPVKDIDKNAYMLLRLSKGASGAFEAFLRGGQLKLTDGTYDFDETKRGGVVDRLLTPMQGEHHDFLRWVAANRAERLKIAGKENLFSEEDIKALKSLDTGVAAADYTIQHGANKGKVTRDRTLIYPDALKTFNDFSANVLDMAEQSGLIDGEARKLWENEFYVPFYRVEDDGSVAGADIKNGAVRQQAFKSLTGRTNKLNADLLDNTLMNWAHLLDAAAKNRAAKATIEAAEKMGSAAKIDGPEGKGSVWFRENGAKRYSMVDDPYLLTAISALEYAGMRSPVMQAMGAFKHALTRGVTASPFFKIRNLIRDSVQVIGTSTISPNAATNIATGWKLTDPHSDEFFRLLAGGGTIHFGTMMEGSEAKRVQQLVESGIDDATILNDENKVKEFYRRFVQPAFHTYNELGDRGEAINRAALYDQLVKGGMSHAEASLQARDLMDFSMQGSFTTVRFLTQVVPFFNARLQGLYKLGKSAKEDPARFSAVLGAVSLLSIGLLAAGHDDDDWKKREDYDRNNYWWFKVGGVAFRIPKPFEIGAIATLAERGFELAFDKEMTNKRFMNQVLSLVSNNLSMNPIPQLVKPMLDVYANQDSFTNRPIETLGMENLKSEYRFNDRTSMVARGLSTAANAATGVIGQEALSPVQIDHLLQGYFGWLGSFVVGTGDILARLATGQPERATPDYWKTVTGGMVSDLRDAPSRYVSQMYTQAKEIEQSYATWQALHKEGKNEEAATFLADHKTDIVQYRNIEQIKRREGQINAQIVKIQASDRTADDKRAAIRILQVQKDRMARSLAPA